MVLQATISSVALILHSLLHDCICTSLAGYLKNLGTSSQLWSVSEYMVVVLSFPVGLMEVHIYKVLNLKCQTLDKEE